MKWKKYKTGLQYTNGKTSVLCRTNTEQIQRDKSYREKEREKVTRERPWIKVKGRKKGEEIKLHQQRTATPHKMTSCMST